MIVDAVVLAGGRSSRLGGASKVGMRVDGETLLQITISALATARRIVAVGDREEILAAAPGAGVTVTRESPPFSGPANAIAAGVRALTAAAESPSDFTIVVACDMPMIGAAIPALIGSLRAGSAGSVAIDDAGVVQNLAGIYESARLGTIVDAHERADDLVNLSVRALLAEFTPELVTVPSRSTADVDTWDDAKRFDARHPDHLFELEG